MIRDRADRLLSIGGVQNQYNGLGQRVQQTVPDIVTPSSSKCYYGDAHPGANSRHSIFSGAYDLEVYSLGASAKRHDSMPFISWPMIQMETWDTFMLPRRAIRRNLYVAVIALFLLAMLPRSLSYAFSLPYIDHPDEPAAYLKALEVRGLFDLKGYHQGYPPAYIVLEAAVQSVSGSEMAATIRLLRWISALADALVAVLIALDVRRLIGARRGALAAGWVTGAAWAVGPLLVAHGVYAIPDPLVALCTALAFHLALVAAQQADRRHWCVLSVAVGLLAVALKYNALPALLPGGLVAIGLLFTKGRVRALRFLIVQAVLCLAVAFILLFVYRADLINTPGTSDVVRGQGLANVMSTARIVSNMHLALQPISPLLLVLLAVLPFMSVIWGLRRSSVLRNLCLFVVLGSPVVFGFPWIASAFAAGEADSLRFVLPATVAVLIIVGVTLWWVATLMARLIGTRAGHVIRGFLVFYGLVAMIEPTAMTMHLVEDRQRPDSRVALRAWADASLEPGLVLVDYDNHKTFNPFWGGLTGQTWFDWLVVGDYAAHSAESWRLERGAMYAVLPRTTASAQPDLVAQWLHLRDFAGVPDRRGPEVSVYRTWKPQIERWVELGGEIALVGYDLQPVRLAPGVFVKVRPYWQVLAPVRGDYSVFLHLVQNGDDVPLVQADGSPSRPARPTTTWDTPSETLVGSLLILTVPNELEPGEYALRLGLYNYRTGERLRLTDGRDWVEIASAAIPEHRSR